MVLCWSLGAVDVEPIVQSWRNDGLSPVAAVAWTQAHCDSPLVLSQGTPRLQSEDLLLMTGGLDNLERTVGHSAACAEATALGAAVSRNGDARAAQEAWHRPVLASAK